MTWPERAVVFALVLAAVAGLALLPPRLARPYAPPVAWDGRPRFSVERAWPLVETLATRFPRRWSGGPDRRAAADWLAARLAGFGLEVHRETFTAAIGETVELENVWAVSRGSSPEIVVALGNYDMAPTSYQAASDTAAHVGTLLELARVIHAEPHRRTFVFLFPDGEEWGMIGARHFARTYPERDRIVASVTIEDLGVGQFTALHVDAIGQFSGFAPMWLRGLAADAAAREDYPTIEVGPVVEWLQRSVLVSWTDQGPFLDAGIPSVLLGGTGDDPLLASEVYHMPSDTIEKMRPSAVHAYGRIQERVLRAIDAMAHAPREPMDYLRLGPDRVVPAGPLLAVQALVFTPLLAAVLFQARTLTRQALVREAVAIGGILLVFLAGLVAARWMPALGLLPAYELYPATTRHPLLTDVHGGAVLAVAAVVVVAAVLVRRTLQRAALPHDDRAIAAALAWLLVVAVMAFADNPFGAVTFLALPAWLWVWVGSGRSAAARAANAIAIGLGFLVLVMLFVQYAGALRIGPYVLWYTFMSLAYGQFTLLRIVLALAMIAIAIRLLARSTLRTT